MDSANIVSDNLPYRRRHVRGGKEEDPDSVIVEKVSKLPRCRFDRHYTADELNHDVFTLYY